MNYDTYINWCPLCGGNLFVSGLTASCNIPLTRSGFDVSEAKLFDSYDEIVKCNGKLEGVCKFVDGGLPEGTGWHYVVVVSLRKASREQKFSLRVTAYSIEEDGERGDYSVDVTHRAYHGLSVRQFYDTLSEAVRGNPGACLQLAQLVGEKLASQHDGNTYEIVDLVTDEGISHRLQEMQDSIDILLDMEW